MQWTLLEYAKFNKLDFLRRSRVKRPSGKADVDGLIDSEEAALESSEDIVDAIANEERLLEDMISEMSPMEIRKTHTSKDIAKVLAIGEGDVQYSMKDKQAQVVLLEKKNKII